jgi:hypothetical protein
MEKNNLTIIDGTQFSVFLWKDKAIKFPKKNLSEKELKKLTEIQNKLSSIKGVPKIKYCDGFLIEEKISGKTFFEAIKEITEEEVKFIKLEQKRILREIKQKGYILGDRNRKNTIYDKETKTVTLIDFYDIKNISNQMYFAWDDKLNS